MRILVPIKQVPETSAVKMDETTGAMVRDGVEAIVNPLDLYAIELALVLRAQHGGEVIVVSMGPPKAVTALREALAMGCDQAVLLSDRAFAGSDTWATARVLSAAVRKLGDVDLILCGERATDGDTGQVGPGLAAFLDLPVVSYVSRVESVTRGAGVSRGAGILPARLAGVSPASGEDGLTSSSDQANGTHHAGETPAPHVCRVQRMVETGYEVLEITLPGVLTVVKEVASPRLPTLRGKQRARQADILTWSAADLGVDPAELGLSGSPTRVVKIFKPTVARKGQKIVANDQASIDAAADKVVEFLKQRTLL